MKLYKIKIVLDETNIEYHEFKAERSQLEDLGDCWLVRLFDADETSPFFVISVPKKYILVAVSEPI